MTKTVDQYPPLWLRRTPDGFAFRAELDRQSVAERFGVGALCRAELSKPRSGRHHRWFWALIRATWEQQQHYATPEALLLGIKFRLGYVDELVLHDGEIVMTPQSIAYDKMDQGDFKQFVDRVLDLIIAEIIPGLDAAGKAGLLKRVDQLLGKP